MRPSATLLVALSLLASCMEPGTDSVPAIIANPEFGPWQSVDPSPARLVLERTFGDDESRPESLLGSGFAMTVDDASNVYVVDFFTYRLLSFAPDGTLRWTAGSRGQGPAEFENMGPVFFDGTDGLVLSSQSGARIDVFDLDGRFVDSKGTEALGLPRAFVSGVLDDDTIVLSSGAPGMAGAHLAIVSTAGSWSVIDTFTVDLTGDLDLPDVIGIPVRNAPIRGTVALAHPAEYRYSLFDPSGREVRQVSRGPIPIQPPVVSSVNGGIRMRNYSELYPPRPLPDGRWLGGGRWPIDMGDPDEYAAKELAGDPRPLTFRHTLDLYEADDRLLYSFDAAELEELGIGRLLATDSQGRVYVEMAATAGIGRFRLAIDDPGRKSDAP